MRTTVVQLYLDTYMADCLAKCSPQVVMLPFGL